MSGFNPKVSIVIPVYNGANFLREAVDSALAQTYANCEVIVVNDGSTDNGATRNIALSYADRIRYFEQENGGVSSALNRGIRAMEGEYFSWLSHDDMYYPDKIQVQLDFLRHNDDKEIILYSDYEYVDSNGRSIGFKRNKQVDSSRFRYELLLNCDINGCALLVPKSAFKKAGLFNETLRTTQDYDMWFRLAHEFRFFHQEKVLIKSRTHAAQGTNTISNHFKECTEMYTRFLHELSIDEIRKFNSEPLALFYTKTAVKIKLRGYTWTADSSMELSRNHLAEESVAGFIQRKILTGFYHLLNKKLKPSYWLKRGRPDRHPAP